MSDSTFCTMPVHLLRNLWFCKWFLMAEENICLLTQLFSYNLCINKIYFMFMTFWRIILPPSSGLESKPLKKPAETGRKLSFVVFPFHYVNSVCFLLLLLLLSFLAYSLTLKMEVTYSSKTLDCVRTTWCYNPGDHTLYSHCCENHKSRSFTNSTTGNFLFPI
jgi:hypothetical protein